MKNPIIIITVFLVLFITITYAQDENGGSGGEYLGKYSSNPYDSDSVSNPYGQYGSQYSSQSINNPYSQYGSPYSSESANNPYATDAPVVIGGSGGSE